MANGVSWVRAPLASGTAARSAARFRLVMPVAPMVAVTLPSTDVSEELAAGFAAVAARTAAASASMLQLCLHRRSASRSHAA